MDKVGCRSGLWRRLFLTLSLRQQITASFVRNWQYNCRFMLGSTISSGGKVAGFLIIVLLTIGVLVRGPRLLPSWSSDQVHFSRDIRPILNQNCMHCHGGLRPKHGVS